MGDETLELNKAMDQVQLDDDKNICAVCKKWDKDMKFCGGCKSKSYCSPTCQKQDWKQHKGSCGLFKICDDPVFGGKGWMATRDMKAGTVLLDELPAFLTPDSNESFFQVDDFIPSCIVCGLYMKMEKNRRCSSCQWPVCSADCESLACHIKNECQVFQKAELIFPPPLTVFMTPSMVAAFITMIRGFNLKKENESLYNQLIKLQDVASLPEKREKIAKYSQVFEKMLQFFIPKYLEGSIEDYLRIFRITNINGFSSLPSERVYDEKGKIHSQLRDFGAVYIKASRMNHSCSPNCSWFISPKSPFNMRIRTCVNVKKGEFLTVPYSDPICTLGTLERQKSIREKFGFICKCPRCLDPTEFRTFLSAFPCNCFDEGRRTNPLGLAGCFVPENPLNIDQMAIWKCFICGDRKPALAFNQFVQMLKMQVDEAIENGGIELEMFVNEYQKRFSLNHWTYHKAARALLIEFMEQMDDLTPKQLQLCVSLCKTVLEVEEKIAPGLSYIQVKTWRIMGRALMKLLQKERKHSKARDCSYKKEMCLKALNKAMEFYKDSMRPESGIGDSVEISELKKDLELAQSL